MNLRLLPLTMFLFGGALHAQRWKELNTAPDLFNNIIFSTVADKAGKVYAAGGFTDSAGENAVAVLANNQWTELGSGAGHQLHAKGAINALTLDSSGNLYAGGLFTDAGGHYYVAKWDGRSWSETGPASSAQNFTGQIFCLAPDKQGNLYAAGEMIDSAGNYYVSKFDGVQWQRLGSGTQSLRANGILYAVLADPEGNVYVAGQFTNAAGNWYVAKWNGSGWSELGSGAHALNANGAINSLAIDAAGNIYAAGDFKDGSGHRFVAKWDGSDWSELGTGSGALAANSLINTILVDAAGNLYAAGMSSDSTGNQIVSRWTGSSWSAVPVVQGLGQFNNYIFSLAEGPEGSLYVAGNFTNLKGNRYVARDSAGIWTEPGVIGGRLPGDPPTFRTMAVDTAGHVFAILGSNDAEGIPVAVRWTDSNWVTLPDTANGGFVLLSALAPDSLGHMYASGSFGGVPGVARWNGTGWTMIPNQTGDLTITNVSTLATDKQGNIYISGSLVQNGNQYKLAKWNGSEWTTLAYADIEHFIVDPVTGVLYATTLSFANSGYNVLKIENNTITDIGIDSSQRNGLNANSAIDALTLDASGNLYAAGSIEDSQGNAFVTKWDGSKWLTLGKDTNTFGAVGNIRAIVFDKQGNLFAGGTLMKHSGTYIGAWNGNTWLTVGDETEFWHQLNVGFMGRDGQGNIYATVAGGVYKYIGGSSSPQPPVCGHAAPIHLRINQHTISGQTTTVEIDAEGIPEDSATTYSIEFALDRDFTQILSGPSKDSVLNLSAADLTIGQHTIFGKMQTLDKCNQSLTSIDSVSITKTSTGNIVDQDFPNSPIGSYPNPVADNIHVDGLSATKSYTIKIYNNQGSPVTEVTVNGQTDVNISSVSLQPGVYWLEVYDNSKNRKIGVTTLLKGR